MPALFAGPALLPKGWRASVRITTATDGTIAVEPDTEPLDAERTAGPVVPDGVWRVRDGHRPLGAEAARRFAQAMRTLAGSAGLVA